MQEMGVVNGISSLGYSSEDIPALVKGTIPQVVHPYYEAISRLLYTGLFWG